MCFKFVYLIIIPTYCRECNTNRYNNAIQLKYRGLNKKKRLNPCNLHKSGLPVQKSLTASSRVN